ncbi:hypothetical protein [Mesorhizobium sp.]|uniref:hypothetical protein n=1 Tax=Mesorhizobium sp. TaxID=1871066 RepID=UPI00120F1686|nr:hypothetical protein [Mesorhizobium sp.]TIX28902.1 MAG: hypothetical protein E5V35_00650 [Mesorhizobium sp.]
MLVNSSNFHKNSGSSSGYHSRCKACQFKRQQAYKARIPEVIKAREKARYASLDAAAKAAKRARDKKWEDDNREVIRERQRKRANENRADVNAKRRAWAKANPDRIALYQSRAVKNPAKSAERFKRYRMRHPEKVRENSRRHALKIKNDPMLALHSRISRGIRKSLKSGKGGVSWQHVLGYSRAELAAHIQRQFTAGMTWQKFLSGEIHIDHIRPASSFCFTSTADQSFLDCWAMSNLRPMWSADNQTKHAKRLFLI